jgi:hypothetical protein
VSVRPCLFLALIPTLLTAAEPTRVPYTCSDEDVQSFGLDCSEDRPCPVFLELSAADALGSRVFVTGNLHTENVTLYGLLLMSDDGGKTWTESNVSGTPAGLSGTPDGRVRSAGLEQIQFVDLRTGWVSGVMLEPLPRDPFLLATTDGGATWRKRPLFEEPRFGSIEQFWFDSPSEGELIVDQSQGSSKHFERYESRTAGSSWSMAEVGSKPLKLSKPHPKQNPVWRVRVDSATRTYHVERATGAQAWETVAIFSVNAGECK